jgi:hypothetical protein
VAFEDEGGNAGLAETKSDEKAYGASSHDENSGFVLGFW